MSGECGQAGCMARVKAGWVVGVWDGGGGYIRMLEGRGGGTQG